MTTITFSNILYFKNDGGNLSYSTDNKATWTIVSLYPVTLIYTGSSTDDNVYLDTNITFTTADNYFIIGSQNIYFNGQNYTVTISNVTDYYGLFQNGTGPVAGYSNVTIKNIVMDCTTSTLTVLIGWFTQEYYSYNATNNILENLSSNGPISSIGTGGICGSYTSLSGSMTIANCYSTGPISSHTSGGICGPAGCFNNGTITITNCYSTGNITGSQSGGICGNSAGTGHGTVNISNCYSTGNIAGDYAGGICGANFCEDTGVGTIQNCYSTGVISGAYAGGIGGDSCGNYNSLVTITNCYSTGEIYGPYSGGIVGSNFSSQGSECSIINCYTRGNVTGNQAGGICGANIGYNINTYVLNSNITINNCYSYGTVSTDASCGSICGGKNSSYQTNKVTVNISYCYTVNEPFLSSTIISSGISFNETNSSVGSGTWNDLTASSYLANAPTYSGNILISQGSVWVDKDPLNLTVPFIFVSPYAPTITSVNPSSVGTSNPVTQVTITGTNLNYNTTVLFGTTTANNITSTESVITCTSPNISARGQLELYVITTYGTAITYFTYNITCFNEGTKILCLNKQGIEEYIQIENLRKGNLVKTCRNGYKEIDCIGKSTIKNPISTDRIKDRLYILKNEKYPELFEDLIITGCHSILVDDVTDEQRRKIEEIMKYVYVTDQKYRLLACVDERAEPYINKEYHTIYHIALENQDYYMNYGIYANGLLVETTSKRWLRELSGMTFIE